MEKSIIKKSLERYFIEDAKTDYAVMITGEWGIGKTYFLRKEVFPLIEKLHKRPIYISLIGFNDVAYLENKVFQKINPFFKSESRSALAIEADHIESIINGPPNSNINLTNNLVLCFDDLERIKPEFLESAMGFINIFIEYYKTNCIFLCNESKLIESCKKYKTIKEKYIRYTYSFTPELREVLEAKISNIKKAEHSYYDMNIILEMFKRGQSYNLRTLFFTLSIFEHCLLEIDKLPPLFPFKDEIIKFILTYCCFYTIETKKGTPPELLDKITIARKLEILIPNLDNFFNNNESNDIKEETDKTVLNNESQSINKIQQSYFVDSSIDFERFVSIAEYIKVGYFDTNIFKDEIKRLKNELDNKEKRKNEEELVNSLNNVFEYSDKELHEKMHLIKKEVKKGYLSLINYLKLYQNLIWIESIGIIKVKVNDVLTGNFEDGVIKAFNSGKLEYIQNLKIQTQWNIKDKSEFANKYTKFANFVYSINDKLYNQNESANYKKILKAISDNRHTELFELLSPETGLRFNEKHASEIYSALVEAHSNTISHFNSALNTRYTDHETTINQMAKYEKEFILKLFSLLSNNSKLNINYDKTLTEAALLFLKNNINAIIEYRF